MPPSPCRSRLAVILAASALACGPAERVPPNVVLIVVESLRADHVSHLGYERATATGLDVLQGSASLFSNATTPTSACVASTASLLTGLSPGRHGANGEKPHLADTANTLAEHLAPHGWRAIGISHHAGVGPESGFARGFERFEASRGALADHPDAAEMVAWLREWLSGEPEPPYFLYLHLMNPHGPYRTPPDRRAELLGHSPSRAFQYDAGPMRGVLRGRTRIARAGMSPALVRSLIDQYDVAVRYTLDRVGDLFAMLRHAGAYDDALIIVVGNHGEELFDDGGFGHGYTLRDEVLRVPLYVKLPGAAPSDAPGRIEAAVSTTDVVPTVLDVLGLPPVPTDGRSLVPLLRGEIDAAPRDFVYWLDEPQVESVQRALVTGRHKLIDVRQRYDGARRRILLYDRVLDPGEEHDLAVEAPEIARELRFGLARAAALVSTPTP